MKIYTLKHVMNKFYFSFTKELESLFFRKQNDEKMYNDNDDKST
jgi:hypothetical protein